MKNPQFLANQAQTLAILPIHEMVILTKFHNDWMKIVHFSLIAYFRASLIFYFSLFIFLEIFYTNHDDRTLLIIVEVATHLMLSKTHKETSKMQ